MSNLGELVSLCKASVTITINDHRDCYKSVVEYMAERQSIDDAMNDDNVPLCDPAILDEMIKRDSIVQVHCYPRTPIGFFEVWHYDVDEALKLAIQHAKELHEPKCDAVAAYEELRTPRL